MVQTGGMYLEFLSNLRHQSYISSECCMVDIARIVVDGAE